MEPTITADGIYSIFQRLKNDGLSDAEIKKTLVQIFMGDKSTLKTFYFEEVASPVKKQSFFSKKYIFYSIGALFCSYLVYLIFIK
jgi:hypothetical protein